MVFFVCASSELWAIIWPWAETKSGLMNMGQNSYLIQLSWILHRFLFFFDVIYTILSCISTCCSDVPCSIPSKLKVESL
jgi:hypothetical protein